MSSNQIRNQFRVVMLALAITFVGVALSGPATAQSIPGEPCWVCTPAPPGPSVSTPKPKPRPVVCTPFRLPGLRGLFWCPGVGLVWVGAGR